jgi:hypothetical protein
MYSVSTPPRFSWYKTPLIVVYTTDIAIVPPLYDGFVNL